MDQLLDIGLELNSSKIDCIQNPPYNVKSWNMANVDEKGFLMGVPWHSNVVIFRMGWEDIEGGSGKATVPQGGSRELITVIDCICADGTVLTPFIIMKGAWPSMAWSKNSGLEKAEYASSPNGWVDSELFFEWM